MKITLAINYVNYDNPSKKKRQDVALSVLLKNKPKNVFLASFNLVDEEVDTPPKVRVFRMLKRNSQRELGNNRPLPYIKEILNLCSQSPCNVFGYVNSDILLSKDFFHILENSYNAFIFYKKDIEKVDVKDFPNNIKIVDATPCGVDGIFFNKKWWFLNSHLFPNDLVLGETEWDTVYNSITQKVAKKYYLGRDLMHVVHERIWTLDSRGAIHNTLIWNQVRDKYGIPQFDPENKEQL